MTPLEKKKEKVAVRDYLRKHPDTGYEKLVAALGIHSLSKPYFYNIRGTLRKNGTIPGGNGAKREGRNEIGKGFVEPVNGRPVLVGTHIEILETVDATGMTQEIKDNWKLAVLPLLKRILPNGKGVTLVFLSDPPIIEIRKTVS